LPYGEFNSYSSGTVKGTCKMIAPKNRILGVGQFNGVIQIYFRLTRVAMVNKFWYLNTILFITKFV